MFLNFVKKSFTKPYSTREEYRQTTLELVNELKKEDFSSLFHEIDKENLIKYHELDALAEVTFVESRKSRKTKSLYITIYYLDITI